MATELKFGRKPEPIKSGVTYVPRDVSEQGLPLTNQPTDSVPELSNCVNKELSDDKHQHKAIEIVPEQSINDKEQNEEKILLREPVFYSQGKENDFEDLMIVPALCPEEQGNEFVDLRIGSAKCHEEAEKDFLDMKSVDLRIGSEKDFLDLKSVDLRIDSAKFPEEAENFFLDLKSVDLKICSAKCPEEVEKDFLDLKSVNLRIGSAKCPEKAKTDFLDLKRVDLTIGSANSSEKAEKDFLDLKSVSSSCNHSSQHIIKVGQFKRCLEKLPETGTYGCFTGKVRQPVDGSYSEVSHYHRVSQLVKRSYVDVGVFEDKLTKELFIRKQVSKETFNKNECIIPVYLNHPNIVEIFGVIQTEWQKTIQVELFQEYAGPTLITFMQKNFPILDDDIWSVIHQGVSTLEYLHRHGVIHLDIKPDNVCISRSGNKPRLKVIDFGSAKRSYQTLEVLGWTPEYMSSESCQYILQEQRTRNFNLRSSDITPAVDVFAFGLTIAYMLTGFHVLVKMVLDTGSYGGLTKDEQFIVKNQIIWKMATEGESCLNEQLENICCSVELRTLLSRMCCPANSRWTSGEILNFLNARERNKTGHRQRYQIQHTLPKETNTAGTGSKKRKYPCQTVGLDSSIPMIQTKQEQYPATDHQKRNNTAFEQSRQLQTRETKATTEQVPNQIQYTYPYEASSSTTRISRMTRDLNSSQKRVPQELPMETNQAQETSIAVSQNSIGHAETTGQYQLALPNIVSEIMLEAPDPGVGNPAIKKGLRDKILGKKGILRVSGSVMPAPRMTPENPNGTGSALIQTSQESPNVQIDGSGQNFGGGFADSERGDRSQLDKRNIPDFGKIDN